ncbi:hypothetical protein [Nocardia fluminea]|uniref:hypothetical protein n=1 Tax=Nocardia fluminea TaxID=134984 RepID=UPI003793A8F0
MGTTRYRDRLGERGVGDRIDGDGPLVGGDAAGAIVLAMFGSGSPATTIAGMFAATASATVVVQLAGRHRRERAVVDMLHGAKGPVAMQIARGLYPRDSEVELAQIRARMLWHSLATTQVADQRGKVPEEELIELFLEHCALRIPRRVRTLITHAE